MIYCNKCGGPLDARGVCSECVVQASQAELAGHPGPAGFGQTIGAPHQQGSSTYSGGAMGNLPSESQGGSQKPSSFPTALVVVLGGVGILVIALLIYFAASRTPSVTTIPPGSPTPSLNRSPDFRVSPSPAPSKSNPIYSPTATPPPGLPDSFDRAYRGTMGKDFTLTVTLTRLGRDLSGKASTSGPGSSWDRLEGTIEPNGHFTLEGHERGGAVTGDYEGWIRERTVNGTYTSRLNRKSARFHLNQQD